jgi:alpha-galactosidase/6-phospho-beta-glucosidase family protein
MPPQLAALLDPHTSAELTIDEIYSLVDDLIAEHGGEVLGVRC